MSPGPPVILLGFDAMDPELTRRLAAAGRLPAFARLLAGAATCPIRNPPGLFVGSLWTTFFTGWSAARTGYHCWVEVDPATYAIRGTTADEIRGTPFWEHLSAAGRRVAVLDVPHSRAGAPLNGIQVSEWGCHDRHFGLRSHPPELAAELVRRHGTHPVLGADAWSVREWAPDDYEFRAGALRTGEEEGQLLSAMLEGGRRKDALSREILSAGEWDLFLAVFGEPHSIGHQSWHVRDPDHPRHDPALLERIGDPLVQVYEEMDRALAAHLAQIDDAATVMVLLSHGMGPHYDATHLLPEILRGLHRPRPDARSLVARAIGRAWSGLPRAARPLAGRALAPFLRRRAQAVSLSDAAQGDTEDERRSQRAFMAHNNFVVGGVRINLRGREPDGVVAPEDLDAVCSELTDELLALVNVDTGGPVVRAVERSDLHYERRDDDTLPDLFLEWNHDAPVETIWSPRLGMAHSPYVHWRTGDHRPGGMLFVRSPRLAAGSELPAIAIEDLGPTIAVGLGVDLADVDGQAAPWAATLLRQL